MEEKEIIDIINSFKKSDILYLFIKNFGDLFVDNKNIIKEILIKYKNLNNNNYLNNKEIDFILNKLIKNKENEEYVKNILLENFRDYYVIKNLNNNLIIEDYIDILNEENIYEFIDRKVINKSNVSLILENNKLSIFAYNILITEEDFIDDINKKVEDIYIKLLLGLAKCSAKKEFIYNKKIRLLKKEYEVKIKEENKLRNLLLSENIDKLFLLSSKKNQIMFEIKDQKHFCISLLETLNNKKNKNKNFNLYVLSLIKNFMTIKESCEFLLSEENSELLNKLNINRNFDLMFFLNNDEGTLLIKEKNKYINIIKNNIKEINDEIIFFNKKEDHFLKLYIEMNQEDKEYINKKLLEFFSFDNIDLKLIRESKLYNYVLKSNNIYNMFFKYLNINNEIKRNKFFEDSIIDFTAENWFNNVEKLKISSPLFYEKEILTKNISLFRNNKEIYLILEKENLLKNIETCKNEGKIKRL